MEYGCIGKRLIHSFSKEIHAKLFNYKYELLELSENELPAFLNKRDFKAINVTIPYKKAVIPYLYSISPIAEKIGAVNTVVNKNGKLYGYNTDFYGLKALIEKNDISLKDKKVLILGSGGTSATAKAVAEELLAKSVLRVSRKKSEGFITYDEALKLHSDAQIIINTTPVGMYPNINGVPIDINAFKKLIGVVDVVYNPLKTELVVNAEKRDIKAVGGLYMLVAQAVFAAERFTDTEIEGAKIDKIFKEVLKAKENIVLIGMPSSGKSTIGALLAKSLNKNFVDTDTLIEEEQKLTIREIFDKFGEEKFRVLEAEAVERVSALQNTVIATGGGAVLRKENVENLSKNGKIFFLDRPLDRLITTDSRPLSSDRESLIKRYNERYDIYLKSADYILKCDDDKAKNIELLRKEFLK